MHGEHDAPFCAWVSFPDPHHPFDCPEPWSRLHDPDEVELPVHRRREFAGRPRWHEEVLTAEDATIRKEYSRIPEQSDARLAEIIANTFGQIALIDHRIGRLMLALADAGLERDTVVVVVSDHGDWLGDHGLVLKGPMHHEGLLRVPMIWSVPGVPAGKRVADPVSTLDLGPTFRGYAAAEPGLVQHGASLRPPIESDDAHRDHALNEWELLPTRAGVALSLQTVRTHHHKLTRDRLGGAGELYDLERDPQERTNLFDDADHAGLRAELEAILDARPDDRQPIRRQVGMARATDVACPRSPLHLTARPTDVPRRGGAPRPDGSPTSGPDPFRESG